MTDQPQQSPEMADLDYFIEAITQVVEMRAPGAPKNLDGYTAAIPKEALNAIHIQNRVLENVVAAIFIVLTERIGHADAAGQLLHIASRGQILGLQSIVVQEQAKAAGSLQ